MKKTFKYSLVVSQIIFLSLLPLWTQLTNYLHPFVIVVVWFCFSLFVLFVTCWLTEERIYVTARILHITMIIYSVFLLILLFFRPNNQNCESVNLIPFETIFLYLSGEVAFLISLYNLGANIGLFIPFGLYYRYCKKDPSFMRMLLITIVSVSMVEGFQFITQRGSLDVDDLILNVLGVSVGFVLFPIVQKVLVKKTN